jgi:hypothetical protein
VGKGVLRAVPTISPRQQGLVGTLRFASPYNWRSTSKIDVPFDKV